MASTTDDLTLSGEVQYNPEADWLDGRYEVYVKDEHGRILDVSFAFTKRGAIRKLHRKMDAMTRDFFLGSR